MFALQSLTGNAPSVPNTMEIPKARTILFRAARRTGIRRSFGKRTETDARPEEPGTETLPRREDRLTVA